MLTKINRLAHTLLPLKPVQHWGLFYYRIVRRLVPFKSPKVKATAVHHRQLTFYCYHPVSWLGNYRFSFLNNTADVDSDTWQAAGQSLLWHFNLHYFDCLNALGEKAEQAKLLVNWWQVHQAKQGVAWEPYPSSLRAVNLCKWAWQAEPIIEQDIWLAMLDRHYQEVRRKLEFHIQANHLFANLKALWFLQAALPELCKKDSAWLCKQISRELKLQFDEQGGHFELSPMYQRIMLWDLLDMLIVGQEVAEFARVTADIKRVIRKAIIWAQALSHPDSEVAFFNDGSMGIAPSLQQLIDYTATQNIAIQQADNGDYSGYIVQTQADAKLVCDAAEIGPAIQPGHAHADTLSFELSIGLQRVIVNSGTSEYGLSAERLRQRSTAAHNTVVLNDSNSSDVWSGFRVGRQSSIIKKKITLTDEKSIITAAHNGYAPSIHNRQWVLSPDQLLIQDTLHATGVKKSYLHFHPNVQVTKQSDSVALLEWPTGQATLEVVSPDVSLNLEIGTWHPEFGKVVRNQHLVLTWVSDFNKITIKWSRNSAKT